MDLIIGGAYQGKLTYAGKKYALSECDIFDLAAGGAEKPYRCFTHLESLTKRASAEGMSLDEFADKFIALAGDSIVISREIGCGVVPLDEAERAYREFHGAALSRLAEKAESVTRIFCGLEEKLK